MTRRQWMQAGGAFVLALGAGHGSAAQAAGGQGMGPRRTRRYGVQLYTVRDRLKREGAATLKAIADIGYKEVEILRADLTTLGPVARDLGLAPVSCHVEAPLATGNWAPWREIAKQYPLNVPAEPPRLTEVAEAARAQGVQHLVVSYLLPNEREHTEAYYQRFADQMNAAGDVARKAGLTLAYHNHAFEFRPFAGSQRPIDVMLQRLDPALVRWQVDVFWLAMAGLDPVGWIKQHGTRTVSLHLKDKAGSVPGGLDEAKVPPTAFKEVGHGSIDFKSVLATADAAGIQHFFVEQDHTPGDPIDSLRASFAHLASLG